jgi:hypothetical protein
MNERAKLLSPGLGGFAGGRGLLEPQRFINGNGDYVLSVQTSHCWDHPANVLAQPVNRWPVQKLDELLRWV